MGGILKSSKNGDFDFRQKYFDEFVEHFNENTLFKVLRAKRGKPNNHKIIIKCINRNIASEIIQHCDKNNIYASNGYSLLTDNLEFLPKTKEIDGCIVELPIENNEKIMNYIEKTIDEFIILYSNKHLF